MLFMSRCITVLTLSVKLQTTQNAPQTTTWPHHVTAGGHTGGVCCCPAGGYRLQASCLQSGSCPCPSAGSPGVHSRDLDPCDLRTPDFGHTAAGPRCVPSVSGRIAPCCLSVVGAGGAPTAGLCAPGCDALLGHGSPLRGRRAGSPGPGTCPLYLHCGLVCKGAKYETYLGIHEIMQLLQERSKELILMCLQREPVKTYGTLDTHLLQS